MSERKPELLLQDILESARKIIDYTRNLTLEQFVSDSKTADAVIRNFEIIGEAAGRLPKEYKDRHTEINWLRIKGFRNASYMIISESTTKLSGRSSRPICPDL